MGKAMCAIGVLTLCCWVATAEEHVVTPQAADTGQLAGIAGHWTIDYVTGAVTPGHVGTDAEIVYDNTASSTGSATSAFIGSELGDSMWMTGGGLLDELSFSIWNSGILFQPLNQLDIEFIFYDPNFDLIGTFKIDDYVFMPPLEPGFAAMMSVTNLSGAGITLPYGCIVAQVYSDTQAFTDELGQAVYDPPVVGISGELFYMDGLWYYFPTGPMANFYYGVGVLNKVDAPAAVYDTGAPHLVDYNASITTLGFSSGNLGAGYEQRWSAMPFTIASSTTIKQICYDWFIQAGLEADNVRYIIWKRTALNAPTAVDKFAEGLLGTYGEGVIDCRFGGGKYLHEYDVNISIPAGDYYLTVYGEGGTPPNNTPWICGGDLQDPSLEQDWFWRSATFPTPGFAQYNPAYILPGPHMPDPLDRWVQCFILRGEAGAPPCPGDFDCNGVRNFEDIDPFVEALGSGTCKCPDPKNCDPNGDGKITFEDIDPFIDLLGEPCP